MRAGAAREVAVREHLPRERALAFEGLRHGDRARRELQRVPDPDQHAKADIEHPELRRRGTQYQTDDGDRCAAADDEPRAVRGLQRAGRPGAEEHQTRAGAAGAAPPRA